MKAYDYVYRIAIASVRMRHETGSVGTIITHLQVRHNHFARTAPQFYSHHL